MDMKEIKRRLNATDVERARSDHKPPRPIRLGDKVTESGMYRAVSLGPDTYLSKGRKARLHNVEIGLLRID